MKLAGQKVRFMFQRNQTLRVATNVHHPPARLVDLERSGPQEIDMSYYCFQVVVGHPEFVEVPHSYMRFRC